MICTTKGPMTKKKPPESKGKDVYELALGYLHQQIQLVIDGTAGKSRHDPAYRVATLVKMIAQVDAERRKARAAEDKRIGNLSRQLVISWFRSLPEEERRSVAREVVAMDAGGSVLS